jgi:hypothetical protein
MAKEKKTIIFIVEGSSDKAALENILKKYTEGIRKLILDLQIHVYICSACLQAYLLFPMEPALKDILCNPSF